MKDFPIDSRGEIGRKKDKVPSAVVDDIQENSIKEIIRGMVRETIKEDSLYAKSDFSLDEKSKGLWHNIQAKRKRGEKPAKPGDDDYPETLDIKENHYDVFNESCGYTLELEPIEEAEYKGREVKLNKPMQGDQKKFKVYVKNEKGNVVVVHFGQGGDAKGGTMRIRKSNPEARKAFRARFNCDTPGPRTKARYWSCKKW
jgi:hypothetical protein